jgi:site-specific recombinase XerD
MVAGFRAKAHQSARKVRSPQFEAAQATLIEAGIPEHTLRGGSFMLRHTFALRQVHAGIDIQRLASWLGIIDLKRLRPYGQISYGPQRPV